MTDRPTVTITLRPTRDVEITSVLRELLKRALRCYGLRAVKIEITPAAERGISPERYGGE